MLPAERALKVISGRWKAIILYHLFEGPRRLSELQRLLPDVSQKVLIQQLREMEEHGIVHREVFRQVPRASNTAQRRLASALSRLCSLSRTYAPTSLVPALRWFGIAFVTVAKVIITFRVACQRFI